MNLSTRCSEFLDLDKIMVLKFFIIIYHPLMISIIILVYISFSHCLINFFKVQVRSSA